MKIIFFLSDNPLAPTTISAKFIIKTLQKKGYNLEIISSTEEKLMALQNCPGDMIIFQKKFLKGHTFEDVKHLKGKVKLVYIDDDFAGMENPSYVATLQQADLVLVGNKQHQLVMKDYIDTPIEVFTSILDFDNYPYYPPTVHEHKPLTICWQQSLADVYIDDLLSIKEPLTKLYHKYEINLHLYGWHNGEHYNIPDRRPLIQEALPFAKCILFRPYEEYLRYTVPDIATSHINIVPYQNIPERYGKSGFALMRTMLLGVPTVASSIGVHLQLIQDGVNGYLATTQEEWYRKIESLILSSELRSRISQIARSFMENHYSPNQCTDIFIKAIQKHMPDFLPE